MNDITLLFCVVLIIHLLRKQRTAAAYLTLALACGSKQMAWVMAPFFFVHLYEKERALKKSIKDLIISKEMAVFAGTMSVIFLPFLIWDWRAFISDVLSYHAGTTGHPYPLRNDAGYGFANLVLHFGLVRSVTSYFPFTLFQVIFTLPLLVWSLFIQLNKPSINQLLSGYAMTLFVFLFFGRYMAANYVGFILSLLTILYFMQERSAD